MWLNREIGQDFRQEYKIEDKLLDVRSEHILEIFRSQSLGEIALLNEKHIFVQKFLYIQRELLAHIPACCFQDTKENTQKNVLILGGFNLEIAYELFKHNVDIDFVQSDIKILDSFISFFPHFSQVKEHTRFHLYEKFIDLPIKKYDIIIYQGIPSAHEIDGLSRMLDKKGILVHSLAHPYIQKDKFTSSLEALGEFFGIVMPFCVPLSLFSHDLYVFASYSTHPLADMWLQKIDMLEDVQYYNADIHQAVFAMPTSITSNLKGIIKN